MGQRKRNRTTDEYWGNVREVMCDIAYARHVQRQQSKFDDLVRRGVVVREENAFNWYIGEPSWRHRDR
jgi:hypothetical protein